MRAWFYALHKPICFFFVIFLVKKENLHPHAQRYFFLHLEIEFEVGIGRKKGNRFFKGLYYVNLYEFINKQTITKAAQSSLPMRGIRGNRRFMNIFSPPKNNT